MSKSFHYTIQLGPYHLEVEFQAKSQPDALAKLQDALLFATISDAYMGAKGRNPGDGTKENIGGFIDFPELKKRRVFTGTPAVTPDAGEMLIKDEDFTEPAQKVRKEALRAAVLQTVNTMQHERA